MFLKLIKQLFCAHYESTWVRNIHGDEILEYNWQRSIWKCVKCNKYIYSSRPLIVGCVEYAEYAEYFPAEAGGSGESP